MISQFFVERPIFANVIAIITVIIGMVFLERLPVTQYPQIVPPTIQVSTRYPGASAEVVAATMGVPIEQAVNGVEGALYMSSTSGSDGSYTLTITFDVGTNLDTAASLVQNLVNSAQAQMPAGVQQQGITVRKVSPNILLVISLYADDERFTESFLSNYGVINLQNPLARLPGVGQVRVFGAGPYSMRVWLDPQRLQSFGLTTADVLSAIQGQNIEVVSGQLGAPPGPKEQAFQFTVTALGRLSRPGEFEDIAVKTAPGPSAQVVRVRDVARVELSQQNYSNYSIFTGHKSAQVVIFSLPDANAIDVANNVYQAIAEMSKKFPDGLKYAIRYDTTKFVRQAVSKVYETLFIAAALVLIVILVFLQNLRAMLVPATTVPVTIIGTFIAMAGLGFTINLMTLFALVLAIGIVVDDAIVIVENSSYYIERGLSPKHATIKAMSELIGPVMGITLALISVFLPAAFLPGITGQIFRQFALVIASISVISAVNALTLKPVQCAFWLKPRGDKPLNRFYRAFNRIFEIVTATYVGLVARMVRRPYFFVAVFGAVVTVAFLFFLSRPTGFLPTEDQGYGIMVSRLPDGASQERSRDVAEKISEILKTIPGVDFWVHIGGLSILDGANVSNMSTTFIVYKDWKERGTALNQDVIISSINSKLYDLKEAQAFVVIPPPIRGLGATGGFQMIVEDRQGLGLVELKQASFDLAQAGNAEPSLRGLATTFSTGSPQLFLEIDRVKAQAMQVPMSNIVATLQSYLGSSFVNLFNKYNQVFQVYIQADDPYRMKPNDIKNLYTRNQLGEMVPLGSFIDVRTVQGPELVTRYNLYPAAAIFGSAAPGFSSGQALSLMEKLADEKLPEGMSYEWTSTSYQEKKVGAQAYFIYALSIILVYLVLAALYESWTSPAAVILVVPMALVGVLLALIARGYDNNLFTQVGLVLMIALASKNAILIVEFARDLHRDGMPLVDAAVEATRRRFRPIVMTSFAFILGVVPLVVAFGAGSAGQRAIGTVVFGGMLSSTLLAIPFVPVFYVALEQLSERVRGVKQDRNQHVQPAPESKEQGR
ncbi:MAG TPA: multidrug efflux RND transporter permease subunit [Dissulfurispiraceae bacterium]|nr:multidrug efflux RND transporter permease subunit [Dissulfurispiraceae bacterium]